MKRVSLETRYEDERVLVWMPRERRMRRDSSAGNHVLVYLRTISYRQAD